jgi:predicted nucleic acid-binding protein
VSTSVKSSGASLFANEIVLAEVPRAIRGGSSRSRDDALLLDRSLLAILPALNLSRLTRRVLLAAGSLEAPGLRTLDAIHVAAAARLGSGIDAFVSYDRRQADAARGAGLRVASPA